MNNRIDNVLYNLSKSNFRSKFHLKDKDKKYVKDKGIDLVLE